MHSRSFTIFSFSRSLFSVSSSSALSNSCYDLLTPQPANFGESRSLDPLGPEAATLPPDTLVGTLAFVAPEMWARRPVTAAADVFLLGVTVVCLLCRLRDPTRLVPAAQRSAQNGGRLPRGLDDRSAFSVARRCLWSAGPIRKVCLGAAAST